MYKIEIISKEIVEKAKTCCGRTPILEVEFLDWGYGKDFVVSCQKCYRTSENNLNMDVAVEKWNKMIGA